MLKTLKRFYSFIAPYKYRFVFTLSLMAISSILSNILPVLFRLLTNSVIQSQSILVYDYLIWIILIVFSQILFKTASLYYSDMVIFPAARDVRLKIFEHLHNLDFAYHVNKSSGSLISLFKRGESAFMSLYDQINLWIVSIILDLVFMIIIFANIYPSLIVISIVTFVANAIFMYFTIRKNIEKRKITNHFDDRISAVVVDNMVGFETVKYFANEEFEQSRLSSLTLDWKAAIKRYSETFRVIDIGNGGIVNLGMIAVFAKAATDLVSGSITTGDFVLAISFATVFFPKMVALVFNFREIAKYFDDLRKYLSVLDEPVVVKDEPKEIEVAKWRELEESGKYNVKFENISFSYGSQEVISDFDLEIKPGESVAFVGRSGAGKTTLTKLLLRFYDLKDGAIRIGGVDIRDISKSDLRKKIGVVPQDTVLFNDTIAYNIAYGRERFTMNDIEVATKLANLYEFIKSLPDGFMTVVGERGIKLSGGQRQRLAIARMIMANTPLIIFDEATSSLDSESEKMVQEAFWAVAKNKTTIIIAHRLSTLKKADRIVVVEGGKIAEIGSHSELSKKTSGIYKHLWELQTSGDLN